MSKRIQYIIDEIVDQYMYADTSFKPWIIGFSGGKDSYSIADFGMVSSTKN